MGGLLQWYSEEGPGRQCTNFILFDVAVPPHSKGLYAGEVCTTQFKHFTT